MMCDHHLMCAADAEIDILASFLMGILVEIIDSRKQFFLLAPKPKTLQQIFYVLYMFWYETPQQQNCKGCCVDIRSLWEFTKQENGLRNYNREEEDNEEVQIENWERPFFNLTIDTSAFALTEEEVWTLTSCCLQRWAGERGRFLLYRTSNPYPASLARIQTAERQEVWPRLDNSGGGYFWKRRAESRQGGVCSVSCWLFCQMWVAECVFMCQNELFVLWGRHIESVTDKETSTWARRWLLMCLFAA